MSSCFPFFFLLVSFYYLTSLISFGGGGGKGRQVGSFGWNNILNYDTNPPSRNVRKIISLFISS